MNSGFEHSIKGNIEYLTVPGFEKTGVIKCFFSTKGGGVSQGEVESLNFGFKRKDIKENVIENFRIFTKAIGTKNENLVLTNQVHSDVIKIVHKSDMGKGIVRESDLIGVDGLVTNEPGVVLVTFFADCVPILLCDPKKRVIANVHSGWRGTVSRIAKKAINIMIDEFGSDPSDIQAAIGPSIGKCHFEVGHEVKDAFSATFGEAADGWIIKIADKYYIDLWAANIHQFLGCGIKEENITNAGECTFCDNKRYFSFRGDKGKTGNLAAFMWISEER